MIARLARNCVLFASILLSIGAVSAQKPKLIVETDIGGDKDDQATFCRLLLYSNEFDIKAIICDRGASGMNSNSARWYPPGANTLNGETLAEDYINRWGGIRPNLILHDSTYPTVASLLTATVGGWDSTTAGVDKIIAVVDAVPTGEIIWYGNWGSDSGTTSNLKRAFDKVLSLRGQSGLASFIAKIRICTLDGALNTKQGYNAEIRAHSMHIEIGYPVVGGLRWYQAFDDITATAGGFSMVSDIQNGHGQLGPWYPDPKEGDSWTIVHLMHMGVSDPLKPWWGGPAGRYAQRNAGDASVIGAPFYWNNQADNWNSTTNRNNTAARFAVALQNDFRARWDWCALSYTAANHPPVAKLTINGSTVTKGVMEISAPVGTALMPTTSASTDPDSGDTLSYAWTYYREAGTYNGTVNITNATSSSPTIQIPSDAAGKQLHFYVQVNDNGSRKGNRVPDLSRFCRLVVNATNTTPAPEINVMGNSTSIPDGDTSPSSTDGTEFGAVDVALGSVTRVFTVQNTGSAMLTLGSVSLSGSHAANFSVTAQPASSVAAGGSTTFSVSFDPSAAGLRSASLSLGNNDANENPYNFAIQGTGTESGGGGGNNLALNGIISAYSAQQTGNEAVKAIDGIDSDDSNRWGANVYPHWIEVDLGANRTFSSTEVHGFANRAYKFRIEARADGGAYSVIVDETSNTDPTPIANLFPSVTARFVKLTVTGAHNYTGDWAAIREFKILANAPSFPEGLEADTFVWDGAAGTNYGTSTTMEVKNGDSGYDRVSFLRFALSGEGSVASATLKLKVTAIGGEGSGPRTVEIRQLADDSWGETGVTWNNQPSSAGTLIASIDAGTVSQVYSVDVTNYISQEDSGDGKASFALIQPGGVNRMVIFGTRENAGNEPALEVVRTTQLVGPEADAHVWDGSASTNYGTSTTMQVKNGSSGYNRVAFLRFSLDGLGGSTANSATLKLKVTGIGGEGSGPRTVEIRHLTDDSWSETGITWSNKPSSTGTLITSINAGTVGQVHEIDVTSYVNQESAGDGKASFVLVQPGGVDRIVNFGSRENSGNEPELDIQ